MSIEDKEIQPVIEQATAIRKEKNVYAGTSVIKHHWSMQNQSNVLGSMGESFIGK